MSFLKESISNSLAQHILVVSHHVPSFEMLSPEFKGSIYNGAFTVELGDYIAIISRLRLYTIFLIHFDPIDIADVDKLSG